MKNKIQRFSVCLVAFFLISCQTVTISPEGQSFKYSIPPDYEQTQNFFFWGLVGESQIPVRSICKDKPVKQMQTQDTFINRLLLGLTIGIYSPRTAKVWCADTNSQAEGL